MDNILFQTSSLNIVAWLLTKGFTVKEKIKIDNQTVFFFDRNNTLQQAINDYNNNQELKNFIAKFKIVKEMAKT
jgi:hypothetical protein